MKKGLIITSLLICCGIQAKATIVGPSISGQAAKDTFIAQTKACGGDCGQSGAGWQRSISAGPIYVECEVLTADVVNDSFADTPPDKFSCTFNTP